MKRVRVLLWPFFSAQKILIAIVNQAMGNEEEMVENLRLARRYARGSEKLRFSNKIH